MKRGLFLIILLFSSCMKVQKFERDALAGPEKSSKEDGYIFTTKLNHKSSSDYVIIKNSNEIRLILETGANDVKEVELVFSDKKYSMNSLGIVGDKEYFSVDVPSKIGKYYFILKDRKEEIFYGEQGTVEAEKVKKDNFPMFEYNKIEEEQVEKTYPSWAEGKVWYKLLIDRFKNGNDQNDPIFNELGAQKFIPTDEKLMNGNLKSELISEDLWSNESAKDNLGKFKVSKWNSDYSQQETWEEKIKEKPWLNLTTKHYGGDIQGIIEKLDYLKELGIDVLEISPPFYSYSYHKFDTIDYRHISPDLGTIEQTDNYIAYKDLENVSLKNGQSEFKYFIKSFGELENKIGENLNKDSWKWTESDLIFSDFLKKADEKDIKIISDIDFRGVSPEFFIFDLVLEEGPKSQYRNWFIFNDWEKVTEETNENIDDWNPLIEYLGKSEYGVEYIADKKYRRKWLETLPEMSDEIKREILAWNKGNVVYEKISDRKIKLNFKSETLKKYLVESSKKWLRGFSGDSRDALSGYKVYIEKTEESFYEEFKKEILKEFPEALILPSYFENYEFVDKLIKTFFITDNSLKLSIEELKTYWNLIEKTYSAKEGVIKQFPLDGIYTDRIYSQLINSDREFDKLNKTIYGDKYYELRPDLLDENINDKLKQIIFLQFFSSATPEIYYGDEVGMWGGDIPYNRKPMIWEEELPYDEESDNVAKYNKLKNRLNTKVVFDEVQGKIFYPVEINLEIYEWYQELIEIYKEYKKYFVEGELNFILPTSQVLEDASSKDSSKTSSKKTTEIEKMKVLVYEFKLENESLIFIINNESKGKKIEISADNKFSYKEILTDKKLSVISQLIEIPLKSNGVSIVLKK